MIAQKKKRKKEKELAVRIVCFEQRKMIHAFDIDLDRYSCKNISIETM
jgi:hypothetical protein